MRAISLPGSAFWACQLPFGYTSYSLCRAERAQKWLHVGAFFRHVAQQLSTHPPKTVGLLFMHLFWFVQSTVVDYDVGLKKNKQNKTKRDIRHREKQIV